MNLIGPELVRDLVTLLNDLDADADVRVAVLESTDPAYFGPHVDLTRVAEYTAEAARAGYAGAFRCCLPWFSLVRARDRMVLKGCVIRVFSCVALSLDRRG
jgi:enoyl-CoA hydratase/carnithine racemase